MEEKREVRGRENYLEKIPERRKSLVWRQEDGRITLVIERRGLSRYLGLITGKLPIYYIHLDRTGSFLWPMLDGSRNIITLGIMLREEFGEATEPLYERLAKYLSVLESYRLITWKKG